MLRRKKARDVSGIEHPQVAGIGDPAKRKTRSTQRTQRKIDIIL
jgi:hypothetical protein